MTGDWFISESEMSLREDSSSSSLIFYLYIYKKVLCISSVCIYISSLVTTIQVLPSLELLDGVV